MLNFAFWWNRNKNTLSFKSISIWSPPYIWIRSSIGGYYSVRHFFSFSIINTYFAWFASTSYVFIFMIKFYWINLRVLFANDKFILNIYINIVSHFNFMELAGRNLLFCFFCLFYFFLLFFFFLIR